MIDTWFYWQGRFDGGLMPVTSCCDPASLASNKYRRIEGTRKLTEDDAGLDLHDLAEKYPHPNSGPQGGGRASNPDAPRVQFPTASPDTQPATKGDGHEAVDTSHPSALGAPSSPNPKTFEWSVPMRATELKIKHLSLCDEARRIRHEERKALRRARINLVQSAQTPRDPDDVKKLLRKSGLTEKQITRVMRRNERAEVNGRHYADYDRLYRHRVDIVRTHARTAHLARALMDGKTYPSVEQKTHFTKAQQRNVAKAVSDLASRFGATATPEIVESWMGLD